MYKEKKVLAVIPARGGSKSVPRKNIRPLGGVPLIAYTIATARNCDEIADVIVSTDDEEIADISRKHGAEVPFVRPNDLATDRALAVPTIQHAVIETERIKNTTYDYAVMLQPTTPFRLVEDLTKSLRELIETGSTGMISVVHVDNWHPMKMKVIQDDGLMIDYSKPPVENPPRQSLPPVYMVNGAFYATSRDVLVNQGSFQGPKCRGYIMPVERSVNIDNELDFMYAELMLEKLNYTMGS
ncbi:MAG: N-acylneuraminate cytidylyltransferase [Ectothiorhodospiraceae bacterium]|nr:N-acylneuraminate cytidylyltransferase [Ectothiorhodospiraceae bacterium]